MKKVIICATLFVFFGCSSDAKKTTTDDAKKNEVGVPNVNGNMPDTTNAINLSTHKKDSATAKDSMR